MNTVHNVKIKALLTAKQSDDTG